MSISEGLIPACSRINRKCGYMDISGKSIIEPRFDSAYTFHDGLAAVILNNKLGYIDKTGKLTIPTKYDPDREPDFNEGIATVRLKGIKFFIDKNGKEYYEP
jgi:hypothetical protein